jgi:large conductance mechanosensitive channel
VAINFLLLAFCVFLLVKWVNSIMPAPAPAPPPGPSGEEKLLGEIRDLLARR